MRLQDTAKQTEVVVLLKRKKIGPLQDSRKYCAEAARMFSGGLRTPDHDKNASSACCNLSAHAKSGSENWGGELMRIHAIRALPPAEKKYKRIGTILYTYHPTMLSRVTSPPCSRECSRMAHKRHGSSREHQRGSRQNREHF